MIAGQLPTVIEQGATYSTTLTWTDGSGNLVNLTGYTAKLQYRDQDGTLLIELNTSNGRITISGTNLTLSIAATDTGALPVAVCNYDLAITSPGGVVTRLVEGQAIVEESQTR
jgi:hypothetical protein